MILLPAVMVAPNGARLTRSDHPALPVTIDQIVTCALACRAAGADGLHAHVRDARQQHVLDAGLYRELLDELSLRAPGFYVQITTEAVGRHTPAEQRHLVEALRPRAVSIALREIAAEPGALGRFFAFCAEAGVGVQHILYDLDDIAHLARLVTAGVVPGTGLMALIVLGRYSVGQRATPEELANPVAALARALPGTDWAVCAFGPRETDCLVAAHQLGGKARIGFENNVVNADGTLARDNAQRVDDFIAQRDSGHAGAAPLVTRRTE